MCWSICRWPNGRALAIADNHPTLNEELLALQLGALREDFQAWNCSALIKCKDGASTVFSHGFWGISLASKMSLLLYLSLPTTYSSPLLAKKWDLRGHGNRIPRPG